MRHTCRVKGDRCLLDPATRHEITVDIVQDLVALDVGMVIGRGNAERVVVEEAWHERTDHEVRALKCLVDGGGWWMRPVIGSKSSTLNA